MPHIWSYPVSSAYVVWKSSTLSRVDFASSPCAKCAIIFILSISLLMFCYQNDFIALQTYWIKYMSVKQYQDETTLFTVPGVSDGMPSTVFIDQ